MPNLLFIGFEEEDADDIVDSLVTQIPDDMEEAVYKAYPNDAPFYAISKESAPYIIIRDNDREQAIRIKDEIQKIDGDYGPLDIEIDLIEFFGGGNQTPEVISSG